MLPENWRSLFLEQYVAPTKTEALEWVSGINTRSVEAQFEFYRERYRRLTREWFQTNLPGLTYLARDRFPSIVTEYASIYPSTSFTVRSIGMRVSEWLKSIGGPQELIDMADLDLAISRALREPHRPAVLPDAFGEPVKIVLQPHVTLLQFDWNVHEVRQSAVTGNSVSIDKNVIHHLLVAAAGDTAMIKPLEPAAWKLLSAFSTPNDLESALAATIDHDLDASVIINKVGDWFQNFGRLQVLTKAI